MSLRHLLATKWLQKKTFRSPPFSIIWLRPHIKETDACSKDSAGDPRQRSPTRWSEWFIKTDSFTKPTLRISCRLENFIISINSYKSLKRTPRSHPGSLLYKTLVTTVPPSQAVWGSNELCHRKYWILGLVQTQCLINVMGFITKLLKTTDTKL